MADVSNETIIAVLTEKFSNMEQKLDRIEDQTAKTNGRVGRLEEWKVRIETSIKASKFYIGVAGLVIGFFLEKIFS